MQDEINFGNVPLHQYEDKKQSHSDTPTFPNGKSTLKFDEFINIVKDSCMDRDQAENYLVYAFSMFDRKK
jgi:Ca2+-binding EF-hand superfamily protein